MDGWFSKAMESVKKGADQLSDQAKKVGEQVKDLNVMEYIKLDGQGEGDVVGAKTMAPWEDVPEAWGTRSNQWKTLVHSLTKDANTFLVGPMERDGTDLGIDWATPEEAPHAFQLACAEDPALSKTRFNLVPRWMPDRLFWVHYYWKVRELGKVAAHEKLEEVLREVNMDPTVPRLGVGERLKNRGVTHEEDVVQGIIDDVLEVAKTDKKITELAASMHEEIKTSEENIALLKRVRGRAASTGSSEALKDSIHESCKYHLSKSESLLQQGMAESPESQLLLPIDGLAAAIKGLHIITAEQNCEGGGSSPPVDEQQASDATQSPVQSKDGKEQQQPEKKELSEDYFGAALPWEED